MSVSKPWRQPPRRTPISAMASLTPPSSPRIWRSSGGTGAVDYRALGHFFGRTYLTDGLTKLLIDVMQRLAGNPKTDPVIRRS